MCSVTCEKPTCADIVVCSDKLEASMITGLSRQTDRQRERERERERERAAAIHLYFTEEDENKYFRIL